MATLRQMPRGDTAAVDAIIIPAGVLYMDLTRNELRLGDGETPGGVRLLSFAQLKNLFVTKDEALATEVGLPAAGVGFLTRLVDDTFTVRLLNAGDGIVITDPIGAAADPSVTVDAAWLATWLNTIFATTGEIWANTASKIVSTDKAFAANAYVTLASTVESNVNMSAGWNFSLVMTQNVTLTGPGNIKVQSGVIAANASGADRILSLGGTWVDGTSLFPASIASGETLYLSYFVNHANVPIISGAIQI